VAGVARRELAALTAREIRTNWGISLDHKYGLFFSISI